MYELLLDCSASWFLQKALMITCCQMGASYNEKVRTLIIAQTAAALGARIFPANLPSRRGLPLARWSVAELRQEAMASGIVAQISGIHARGRSHMINQVRKFSICSSFPLTLSGKDHTRGGMSPDSE